MAKDKGPKFSLNPIHLTIHSREGDIGHAYEDGKGWRVRLSSTALTGKRKEKLEQEMADWYYFTQVKK